MKKVSAFSLVELMVTVTVVTMIVFVAVPNVQNQVKRSANEEFIADLQALKDSFKAYKLIENGWPPTTSAPGETPTDIVYYLPTKYKNLDVETPIGGHWQWLVDDEFVAIAVVDPQRTKLEMQAIDKKIDDEDLSGGVFQEDSGSYNYYLWWNES